MQVGLSQLVAGRIELRDAARSLPDARMPASVQRRKLKPSLEEERARLVSAYLEDKDSVMNKPVPARPVDD